MANYILPTRTDGYPYYDFEVELDGKDFTIELHWNTRHERWYLTLIDSDGNYILAGVCVVSNWDLLRRNVKANRPKGQLIAVGTTGQGDPGLYDLGTRVQLAYVEAD